MPFFLTSLVAIFFFSFATCLLFLFLFSCFFFSSLRVELLFFFFSFLFFLEALCRQLSFFFFLFFFLGGAAFCFSCFWPLFLFFFLGALCFLSLLPSPEQAVRNRSYVLSRLPDRVDILVDPVVTMSWTTCLAPGTKYEYITYQYMSMWNVHRMFITYIQRTSESRNTKNTHDFLVQVRNILLPLSLKVLRHKEKDTHSFYSGFSICPLITCGARHKATGLASASKRKSTVFFRARNSTPWLFQNPPNPPRVLPVHDFIHIHRSTFLFWDFYFDVCERHILPPRALTPALKFAPN